MKTKKMAAVRWSEEQLRLKRCRDQTHLDRKTLLLDGAGDGDLFLRLSLLLHAPRCSRETTIASKVPPCLTTSGLRFLPDDAT